MNAKLGGKEKDEDAENSLQSNTNPSSGGVVFSFVYPQRWDIVQSGVVQAILRSRWFFHQRELEKNGRAAKILRVSWSGVKYAL